MADKDWVRKIRREWFFGSLRRVLLGPQRLRINSIRVKIGLA